jgi:hypothetical protein
VLAIHELLERGMGRARLPLDIDQTFTPGFDPSEVPNLVIEFIDLVFRPLAGSPD